MPRSEISQTDVKHFKSLANLEHIDVHAEVTKVSPKANELYIGGTSDKDNTFTKNAQLARISEDDFMSSSSDDSDAVVKAKIDKRRGRATKGKRGGGGGGSSSGSLYSSSSDESDAPAPRKKSGKKGDGGDSSGASDSDASDSDASGRGFRRRRKSAARNASSDAASTNSTKLAKATETPKVSKRDMLFELEGMAKSHNVTLTRQFTMNDSTADIEEELRFHRQAVSDTSLVTLMREVLFATTAGVEMLNERVGLLSLQGWSSEVQSEPARYDPTLLRIKNKYMRDAVLQPELELAFLLTSSAVSFHIRTKSRKADAEVRKEQRKQARKATKNVDVASSSDEDDLPTTYED